MTKQKIPLPFNITQQEFKDLQFEYKGNGKYWAINRYDDSLDYLKKYNEEIFDIDSDEENE